MRWARSLQDWIIFSFKLVVYSNIRLTTQRGIFHLLAHSPDDSNGQHTTRPKSEARSFNQISQRNTGSQILGRSSTAFPRYIIRVLDLKSSQLGCEPASVGDASVADGVFICYTSVSATLLNILFIHPSLHTWMATFFWLLWMTLLLNLHASFFFNLFLMERQIYR